LCAACESWFTLRWPSSHHLRFSASGEVGAYVAKIAPGIECHIGHPGEDAAGSPLQQCHLDVARQAVDVHIPKVMIGDQFGIGRRLDSAFQIEAGKSPMPGKVRRDD
jgi:hypothetical protein